MANEVVIGATRKDLVVYVQDQNGAPINVAGGSFLLMGTSPDLPNKQVSQAGVITDGPNGKVTWAGIGTPSGTAVSGCTITGTTTITRGSGSWISDGVLVGMSLDETANVPLGSVVASVTATVLTVSGPTPLVNGSGLTVTPVPYVSLVSMHGRSAAMFNLNWKFTD